MASLPSRAFQYDPHSSASSPLHSEEGYILAGELDVHLASVEEKKRLWWRNALINLMFIGSWFFFATVISVYNKWMFSEKYLGFPYPLFVTTMHMFVQWFLASCFRFFWPRLFRPDRKPNRSDYMRKAVPTGIATSLDIGLSNLSLKTITLSFYTMVKSSSLVFVLGFAFLFRLEVFSLRLVGVIVLIVAGVLLMVATETQFVLGGFLLVLSGSALGGFRWSLTQLLLKNKNMGMDNPAATLFWLAPVMGCTLAIVSAVVDDWGALFRSHFFDGPSEIMHTCFYLTAPGVVAFFMVLSEFYILQRAGVVPMSIAGIAKEVTTISLSPVIFGDELTPLNITGVAITVCGIALYTYHKYQRSISSTVPLDAHGNPIPSEEDLTANGLASAFDVDEELRPLAADVEMPSRRDDDGTSRPPSEILFEIPADEGSAKDSGFKYSFAVQEDEVLNGTISSPHG